MQINTKGRDRKEWPGPLPRQVCHIIINSAYRFTAAVSIESSGTRGPGPSFACLLRLLCLCLCYSTGARHNDFSAHTGAPYSFLPTEVVAAAVVAVANNNTNTNNNDNDNDNNNNNDTYDTTTNTNDNVTILTLMIIIIHI